MADLTSNFNYQEGHWSAGRVVRQIEKTEYQTLDNAISNKATLIEQFETEFGFSRDMENIDANYAYNLGFLDKLKEIKDEQDPQILEDS